MHSINERGDAGDYREVFLGRFDQLLLQSLTTPTG
jgi:hypothetical protein